MSWKGFGGSGASRLYNWQCFHSQAYEAAVAALNNKLGYNITTDHSKNRLKTWRKQYLLLNDILSHGGFKWDETQKMIIDDDSLWKDYIKMHQDARVLRGKVLRTMIKCLSSLVNLNTKLLIARYIIWVLSIWNLLPLLSIVAAAAKKEARL